MEVKTAPLTYDIKNLCQNISHTGNSIVYVPPPREKELRKMLITFYRTASHLGKRCHVCVEPDLTSGIGRNRRLDHAVLYGYRILSYNRFYDTVRLERNVHVPWRRNGW
jgi:hypothetical protein